jgi:hypothetical protein
MEREDAAGRRGPTPGRSAAVIFPEDVDEPRRVYRDTTRVVKPALQHAKFGGEEELGALQRLDERHGAS